MITFTLQQEQKFWEIIKIENNVIIGANSVVIKNVEENTIVGGIPAKVISKDIEKIKLYNNIKKEDYK